MRTGEISQNFTGEKVSTMSYVSMMFYSNVEGRNQIAFFSAAGLFASMALVVLAGLQDLYRWF
jgi:predicted exporter